jgi:hypothetical protein
MLHHAFVPFEWFPCAVMFPGVASDGRAWGPLSLTCRGLEPCSRAVSGEIRVNGARPKKAFKRFTGFVFQVSA